MNELSENPLDEYLKSDLPNHSSPGFHLIGRVLQAPPTGITRALGVNYEGVSPLPARADHIHQLAPLSVPAFTPTVTQGVSVAITGNKSKYFTIGKMVFMWIDFTVNGAGTAGSVFKIALPITLDTAGPTVLGSFEYKDSGTVYYCGAVKLLSSTEIQFQADGLIDRLGISGIAGGCAVNDTLAAQLVFLTA